MVERKPNEVKIVAWLLVAKKLIKFANDETSYKINDNVMEKSNFDKFPLKKGDAVEVGIAEGVITYIRKQKNDAPKAEGHGSEEAYEPTPEEEAGPTSKVEAPAPKSEPVAPHPVAESGVRELTVFAVAANKKVVKFLEVKDDGWYQISPEIQAQDYAAIGLIAKNKVKVTFNDKTVTSLVKVASEATEQPKTAPSSPTNAKVEPTSASAVQAPVAAPTAKKEWKPTSQYNDDRQTSIEAQASVNSACEVAGQVASAIANASRVVDKDGNVTTNAPTANIINRMIRAIAEENYVLIQDLKKK
jgi:hypothetical protein